MRVRALSNGNLLVPMRAESEGIIGDGMVEIGPDHPDFEAWFQTLLRHEDEDAKAVMRVVYLAPDNRVLGTTGLRDGKVVSTGIGRHDVDLYVADPTTGKQLTPADGNRWLEALPNECDGAYVRGVLDDGDPAKQTYELIRYLDSDGDEIESEYAYRVERFLFDETGLVESIWYIPDEEPPLDK